MDDDGSELRDFERRMQDVFRVLEQIDDDIETVTFNPRDLASVEAAIQKVGGMIDDQLDEYMSDPKLAPVITGAKNRYRRAIFEVVGQARVQDEEA